MQLCDAFPSNNVKTNTTTPKGTVIAVTSREIIKGAEVGRQHS